MWARRRGCGGRLSTSRCGWCARVAVARRSSLIGHQDFFRALEGVCVTMTDMGDDKDLERLISGHGDAPQSIPVHPPGNVDVTARLGDVVVRGATSGDRIKLTLSGQDGMVTATFGPNDSRIL